MFPIATRRVPSRRVMSIQRAFTGMRPTASCEKPRRPSLRTLAERKRLAHSL